MFIPYSKSLSTKNKIFKRLFLNGLLFFIVLYANAQEESNSKTNATTVAYFGHTFTHSGFKIGKLYAIKQWDKAKTRRKGTIIKHKTLFINPQLGGYHHQKNHSGVLVNAEFGIDVSKNERKFFRAFSFGIGYIAHINSGTTYVLEDDGSIIEKSFASRGYVMPSFNYQLGHHLSPTLSWFSKFTLGSKLNYNTLIATELFFELGLRFQSNR